MAALAKYKQDACWRKNRLAARILLRRDSGRLSNRDILVARHLHGDAALSDRLIDQALNSLQVGSIAA
jgi:hypothetical protein